MREEHPSKKSDTRYFSPDRNGIPAAAGYSG